MANIHTYVIHIIYIKNDQISVKKKYTKYEYLKRFFGTLHLNSI